MTVGAGEGSILLTGAAFVATGLVQAGISVALYFWGQSIAARRRSTVWWWVSFGPLLALLLATVGGIGTTMGLVRSFDAVSQADPELKAQLLADGISTTMNLTAFTVVPSWLLYVASLVAFTLGTFLPVQDEGSLDGASSGDGPGADRPASSAQTPPAGPPLPPG